MGLFDKFKSLGKSHLNKEEETKKTSVERDNIYQSKISDVVIFGFNDLMELANQQFEIVGKTIYEREHEKNLELFTMVNPSGDTLFVDYTSEKQHIYVYKELYLSDFKNITSDDAENREEYFDATEDISIGLAFNKALSTQETSDFWIQNDDRYYGMLREVIFKHTTESNSYSVSNNNGSETLMYVLQSEEREYRFMITIDTNGNTHLFSGRRIEPHDIEKIIGED